MQRTFGTLDGLRGAAALVVLIFHLAPAWSGMALPGSAYLSVDLFFMLSGFVIGHAYDGRIAAGMGFRRFVEVRLIRLYPLYILGCAIGLAAPLAVALLTRHWWIAKPAIAATPWALAMVPRPSVDPADWFLLDPPAWSLFYEMVVNIVYVLVFPWLRERVLLAIALVSGIALAGQSIHYGTINFDAHGWAAAGGFARPAFSFTLGLLLLRWWRRGVLPAPRVPAGATVLLFLSLLAVPASGVVAGVLAPATVMLGFPLVVLLGAASEPSSATAAMMGWAGRLSYPIYALHLPVIAALDAAAHLGWLPLAAAYLAAVPVVIAVAWAALRFYDEPLRAVLGRRIAARRAVEMAPAL